MIIGLIGLTQCKKDDPDITSDETTGYMIDGVQKTPSDVTINTVSANNTWNIRFADVPDDGIVTNTFLIISDFDISTVTETTYNIDGLEELGYNMYYNYDFYAETPLCNTSNVTGNLTITKLDNSSKVMSGTFSAKLCDASSIEHNISNGIFTNISY